MAKSTKTTYKPAKKENYKSVVRMAEGGNVSELDYSERREYIEENYAPFITDAQMIFSIYDSGIEYDYKGDRKQVTQSIIEQYKSLADYTEATLPQETIYEIQDWDLVRKEIDPDTDEVIGETPLEQITADNTDNFSYKGLVNLNWRVYQDEEYDRFFYVIMPHLGGDIRGNYGDAIILEGNDKEELFYRFYEGFISGGVSVYFKFKDDSEIGFISESDSNVFQFRVDEVFEPTGMAQKFLNDLEKLDILNGDKFLGETIDIYLARNGVVPMMMAGGSLNDETPMAYIQILGYDEGKHFNLTDYADGQDVINGIYEWMNGLNEQFGGNREEYEVTDYEGFGDDLYDAYMGENEFEEIIEAYEKYQSSDFPADVISAYKNDSGSRNDSLSDVIDEMDNNYFGKYENLNDFGYEMVKQGVYSPSNDDVYITDTDKRIIAGEEADSKVDVMRFEDFMDVALDTQSEYEVEKSELEDKISEIKSEIDDLTDLQSSVDDDDEYETIAEQIEEKEVELDDVQNELDNIDSRFEDEAKEEAREIFYDEIYNKLENDLEGWLSKYGYDTGNLADVSFLSVDYEKIGDELSSDYLIVEFDGTKYFFNNYSKGGRIMASKIKPKFDYYIVENSTKKLVSGYSTKQEAIEQRKLLVHQYPAMRFEIFSLVKLEAKTDLDVYAKKDYVELSTLDKIKKVSVDAYRYGQEKVGQAQVFLERNDVKGKIKRGTRKVADKTKQGASWLQRQWREADFGDGKGKAKFFAEGGGEIQGYKGGYDVTIYYKDGSQTVIEGGLPYSEALRMAKKEKIENDVEEVAVIVTDQSSMPNGEQTIRWISGSTYADGGGVRSEIIIKSGNNGNLKVIYQAIKNQRTELTSNEIFEQEKIKGKSVFLFVNNELYDEFIADGDVEKYADGGEVDFEKVKKADEIYREHNLERISKGLNDFSKESVDLWNEKYDDRLNKLNLTYKEKTQLNPKNWYADGGGVKSSEFPPKGELTNKDNFLLKYEKTGSEYEFFVYKPITKEVSGYNQIKHVCLNKDCPQKMTYDQFINYLYAELYLDDNNYAKGGNVSQTDSSIDAQKKGVAKRIKIKNWYTKTYPSDDLGEELNDNITFYDLYVLMYQGNEVYSILGVSDSIVRERVFEKLSEILHVDYEYIYNIWLRSDKYAKGGGVGEYDIEILKKKYSEMNVSLNTKTGQVYVGGIKPNNKLYSDDKGYYLIDGYEKFMNKKYPIKKYFNHLENTVLSYYMNDKFEKGGEADALFEIVVVAKGLEKDGGQIIKDRFSINSISLNEAKNIAEKMWEKEMANSDFHIIDILTDTEYREKYLSKKFNKGGESKGDYDVYDNKRMLLNQANEIEHHSEELIEQVNNTKKVPAWVIAKMERATTDLSDITHYLDGENKMAHGGNVGEVKYEILPHINKFIIAKVTYKQQDDYTYPSKEFIYGFNDKFLEFNDMKSAQKFIDNIDPKYPYGIPKANAGMYLMASQFLNKQRQQPQVVYYIPQPQPQELENTGIIQNIPEMASGGDVGYDNELTNDFCITNLIELANELQSVRYYVTNRFKESDFESKTYIGRLTIVFKEPASVNVINSLTKFLERAEDCHHIFEQSVNVSGSEPNGLSINLLSDKFSDIEFGKGGKVYDFAPKKINVAKTKKITTQIGDFNLGLITKDFVYFVNMEESDENGNTMMYNKNGELLSDNYFASNELYETLEKESTFDFIHPMMEIQRQEILKGN